MPENVVMEDSWAPEDRKNKPQCHVYKKDKMSHLWATGASLPLYNDSGINKYKEKGCKYLTHRLVKKKHFLIR